jgi:hypothetical protein
MRLVKSILIALSLTVVISCGERRPSVVIKQGNPQEFIVLADGILDVFSVSGPVRRCQTEWSQERPTAMERYWEIAFEITFRDS